MNKPKTLVLLIISLLIGFALVAIAIVPNKVNEEDFIHIDIANSRVFTYKYGLALYEKGTRQFYNVSPFDMFYQADATESVFQKYVKQFSPKNSVFSWTDNLLSTESNYSNLLKKVFRIYSYFGASTPTATFTKDGQTAILSVKKAAPDKLTFYLDFDSLNKQSDLEMSFSLSEEDIIIDDQNNIYLPPENTSFIDFYEFKNKTGHQIKTYNDIPPVIDTSYIIISNPKMSGYYQINLDKRIVKPYIQAKRVNFLVDSDNPKFDLIVGEYLAERLKSAHGNL